MTPDRYVCQFTLKNDFNLKKKKYSKDLCVLWMKNHWLCSLGEDLNYFKLTLPQAKATSSH